MLATIARLLKTSRGCVRPCRELISPGSEDGGGPDSSVKRFSHVSLIGSHRHCSNDLASSRSDSCRTVFLLPASTSPTRPPPTSMWSSRPVDGACSQRTPRLYKSYNTKLARDTPVAAIEVLICDGRCLRSPCVETPLVPQQHFS